MTEIEHTEIEMQKLLKEEEDSRILTDCKCAVVEYYNMFHTMPTRKYCEGLWGKDICDKLFGNTCMDFGYVIKLLKNHPEKKFSRSGWNGKGQYISLQVPDEHSKMNLPYIYIKTVNDALVPWLASQTDMLADDWYEVE